MRVEALDLEHRFVVLEDGRTLPVRLFDAEGDDCEDVEEAVVVFFGSDRLGWVSAPIEHIPPIVRH